MGVGVGVVEVWVWMDDVRFTILRGRKGKK
jgi:hypothetical protein